MDTNKIDFTGMIKSQRNEVFDALKEGGLDESNLINLTVKYFEKDGVKPKNWNKLSYWIANGGYLLSFDDDGMLYYFCIQKQSSDSSWTYQGFPIDSRFEPTSDTNLPWDIVCEVLTEWARKVSAELVEEDKWNNFISFHGNFKFEDEESIDNSKISAGEAAAIRAKLELLENKIIEQYDCTPDQVLYVQNKFKYVNECVDRQGKADWMHTFVGVLTAVAVGIGLSGSNADGYWTLVTTVVGNTIQFLTST